MADRRTGSPIAAFAVGLLILAFGLFAGSAAADESEEHGARIKTFTTEPSTTQAGGHPDVSINFTLGTRVDPQIPGSCYCNSVKTIIVDTPAGFIADPHVAAECNSQQFGLDECPADSQIGVVEPTIVFDTGTISTGYAPLYNLEPRSGQAGLLGFKTFLFNFPIYQIISARTDSDYGLRDETTGITQMFALAGFKQVMWGVPASPVNDALRYKEDHPPFPTGNPTPSNLPEAPFFSAPTTCAGPLESRITTIGYDHVVHHGTATWPATTGCDQLGFNPSLAAKPSTPDADTPSGLDTSLKVPQQVSPETPSASEIRAASVSLPAGFSINPNAADGKTTCSDAEARLGTTEEAQCPEFAKVGTSELLSSALPGPITGAIYLGEPRPGERYRLILTADGFATHIKILGTVHADPQTGQLTVTFEDLPQSPLTEFNLHFFGSERGLLATPTKCGSYAVSTEFTPWASELPDQTSTQFFNIESGPDGAPCPGATRPFGPQTRAVGGTNGAGSFSPISVTIDRPDGDQNLNTVQVQTPPGLTAKLQGIPYCSDQTLAAIAARSGYAEQASPSCPAASQVGIGWAGAGAGSRPLYVPSRVYLAGPYKGAPVSIAIVTPAVSGPYDLGTVVLRAALEIDPVTAQVTTVSDSLPQILEGIPLRLRTVMINLDRSNFTLNPTSCDPFGINSLLTGNEGAAASPATHFQTANCENLEYTPKLAMKLSGSTKRRGHPALTTVLNQPAGQANTARAVVTLPKSEILDQAHIGTVCTRVQFAAEACPANSVYGSASAVTPLLDHPLEGPVYLRSSNHNLPDLVAALRGPASQPIEIDLAGRIDTVNQSLRASFEAVPDQPVTKFTLKMLGGAKGLLVNTVDLCKKPHNTDVKLRSHSGASADQKVPLRSACDANGSKKRRNARRHRR
jgi:hypothetical protein